jgi:hypothetical protein
MLETQVPAVEFDPFASATNATEKSYDLFGKVEINAWACALVTGQGKVPFDPNNASHKRLTAIEVYVQPLDGIEVKYPKVWECDWIAEFPTWAKITLASIKHLLPNMGSVKEIHGLWARVARVDSLDKPYAKKDAAGNPTGETARKKTFKFMEFFQTEDECRAAAIAAGAINPNGNGSHGNGHNVPTTEPILSPEEQARKTAEAFLLPIVSNAARGKNLQDATDAVAKALAAQPIISKFFTIDSPEVTKLILEHTEAV